MLREETGLTEDKWVPPGRDSFPKLLALNAQRHAKRPASREKMYGIWQTWTWADVAEETRAMALGLMELGMGPGDRMAIVGSNRPPLYWSMVAAQMVGAVPVPVYQDSVAEEIVFVLEHAEVSFVIAENQEQVDKVLSLQDRLPKLRHVIYRDPRGLRKYDHTTLHSFTDVQKLGRDNAGTHGAELDRRIAAGGPEDVCVMLYTSGTTGNPKGVVLTNRNVIYRRGVLCRVRRPDGDRRDARLSAHGMGRGFHLLDRAVLCGAGSACPAPKARTR